MRRLLLFWIVCGGALRAMGGELELPSVFASGMVLQQQADVTLWGWAAPGAKVRMRVSWERGGRSATAGPDGRWSIGIRTPEARNEAVRIRIASGRERVTLSDVLIGEVWFVGGQSNMQMSFRGNPDQPVEDAQRILLRSRRPRMRLFRVRNGYAAEPCDTLRIDGQWTACDPDHVLDFSVIGYVFGERIQEVEDLPVGLVLSAHGGSTAEAWIDRETLDRFGGFDTRPDPEAIDPVWYAVTPTVLYNRMLAPLLPLRVRGVIWYQGEANVGRPGQYRELFPLLIRSWRTYFRDPELPFFYVQIAPYEYEGANSAELREVQLETMRRVPRTGMAVALDAGERSVIHPARKEVIGERLAYWALNEVYGRKAFACRGPEVRSMEVRGGRAVLRFDYAPGGLTFFGRTPSGFEIAGPDRVFHPAEARIVPAFWGNEGLEVWSDSVPEPAAVRYGFANFVEGSLYNTAGLPASSFRIGDY